MSPVTSTASGGQTARTRVRKRGLERGQRCDAAQGLRLAAVEVRIGELNESQYAHDASSAGPQWTEHCGRPGSESTCQESVTERSEGLCSELGHAEGRRHASYMTQYPPVCRIM